MHSRPTTEYGKIKTGTKTLEDAVLNLGSVHKSTKGYINKAIVMQALFDNDVNKVDDVEDVSVLYAL